MPCATSSIAAERVKFSRPLLAVQYAILFGSPWCPAVEMIFRLLCAEFVLSSGPYSAREKHLC